MRPSDAEDMDHFRVFGEKHFEPPLRDYVEECHTERPHQKLGNTVINEKPLPQAMSTGHSQVAENSLRHHKASFSFTIVARAKAAAEPLAAESKD